MKGPNSNKARICWKLRTAGYKHSEINYNWTTQTTLGAQITRLVCTSLGRLSFGSSSPTNSEGTHLQTQLQVRSDKTAFTAYLSLKSSPVWTAKKISLGKSELHTISTGPLCWSPARQSTEHSFPGIVTASHLQLQTSTSAETSQLAHKKAWMSTHAAGLEG